MRIPDRYSGLFLVALGSVAAWAGSHLPPVPGQQVGPNVFPMVVGSGLAICGLMIAFGIGHSFEDEDAPARPPSLLAGLKVLLPPALLLLYYFGSETLGFAPVGFAIVLAMSLALGARWKLALPLAIAAPLVVHYLFLKLLRVPLPIGLVPLPW